MVINKKQIFPKKLHTFLHPPYFHYKKFLVGVLESYFEYIIDLDFIFKEKLDLKKFIKLKLKFKESDIPYM